MPSICFRIRLPSYNWICSSILSITFCEKSCLGRPYFPPTYFEAFILARHLFILPMNSLNLPLQIFTSGAFETEIRTDLEVYDHITWALASGHWPVASVQTNSMGKMYEIRQCIFLPHAICLPFVYFDARTGNLKGIDVSLVHTVAEKLQLSLLVNVINTSSIQSSKFFLRQTDILFGGQPQYTNNRENFDSSLSVQSDDYTWCVQRAMYLPVFISFFRVATPIAIGSWGLALAL